MGARRGTPLQPGEAPDRPVREGGRRPHPVRPRTHARLCSRPGGRPGRLRLGARHPAERRRRRGVRLGGRRPARPSLGRDGDLRAARQGVHAAAARRARRPAGDVCRARLRRRDRVPAGPRRHRGGAAPRPPHRGRALPRRARALELLGLLDDRVPRPARGLRGDRRARGAGARVQGDGEGAPPRRDRGDPRRRLQPHGGGEPPRADAGVQGRRQRRVLPARPRRRAALHGLHGHRELAQPGRPVGAPADHGLAPVLRDRVSCRRVPVRSRIGARARALRRRPPLGVLRRHPPGPRPVAGEADRGAVGRGARRLPGGELPDPLVRVERHVPRHDARLLARPHRGRRVRPSVHRLERPLPGRRPPPLGVDQLRHVPRRLHAPRPGVVRPQAQRGESRGQPRRLGRQPLVELRRRGRDRRPGRQRAPRPADAQHPRDAPPLAGHADAPRRRRAAEHAAREQQRVLPGQRALVARLGARRARRGAARVHEAPAAPACRASGLPALRVPHRGGAAGLRRPRRLVVPAGRPQDDPGGLGARGRVRARRRS